MKKSSLLGHVVEALGAVRTSPEPADEVLQQFFRHRRYLGSSDRRFIGDRLFSILRNYQLLSFLLDRHPMAGRQTAGHPAVLLVLAHEKTVAEESPPAVEGPLAGHWKVAGLEGDPAEFLSRFPDVPALLESLDAITRVATLRSVPFGIVQEWMDRFGQAEADALCRAMGQPARTAIRVNTLKSNVMECRSLLEAEGVPAELSAIAPEGLVLEKRVNVHSLRSFRNGFFELQDEGSQLVAHLLAPRPGECVVDACAGGGGKTLHCASLMQNRGRLISLDVEDTKLRALQQRCRRAGVSIASAFNVKRGRPEVADLLGKADAVLVDAPCSGTGTFRRNPGLKVTFSENRVPSYAARQAKLLDRYSAFVRPGGRLVYATCSLLRKENEEVIEGFLARHREFGLVPVGGLEGFRTIPTASSDYLLLLPHRSGTDGFFGALLWRASD